MNSWPIQSLTTPYMPWALPCMIPQSTKTYHWSTHPFFDLSSWPLDFAICSHPNIPTFPLINPQAQTIFDPWTWLIHTPLGPSMISQAHTSYQNLPLINPHSGPYPLTLGLCHMLSPEHTIYQPWPIQSLTHLSILLINSWQIQSLTHPYTPWALHDPSIYQNLPLINPPLLWPLPLTLGLCHMLSPEYTNIPIDEPSSSNYIWSLTLDSSLHPLDLPWSLKLTQAAKTYHWSTYLVDLIPWTWQSLTHLSILLMNSWPIQWGVSSYWACGHANDKPKPWRELPQWLLLTVSD